MRFFGFDTSNYTTSVAIYDDEKNKIISRKKLLNVKVGERGLRQSEALFQHTVNLPSLVTDITDESGVDFDAVGASVAPRLVEGSYMPCFLAGKNVAQCVAAATGAPFFSTSHQHGHIAAAIFGSGRTELFNSGFIAFHLSGGTTEALLVTPDDDEVFHIELIAESLDLKAGQLIDRTGVLLGLDFPCGAELDSLSLKSDRIFNIKPTLKGNNCCLSGIENQVNAMFDSGCPAEDIASYAVSSVIKTVERMAENLLNDFGDLPLLFAGGVSSNSKMRSEFKRKFNASFAPPSFSADNAAGVAIITSIKYHHDHTNGKSAQ